MSMYENSLHTPPQKKLEGAAKIAAATAFAFWIAWLLLAYCLYTKANVEGLGQLGDSFGVINSIFSAATVGLVAWAGALQRISLMEAQSALEVQKKNLAKQQFENLFFEMLRLTSDAASRIEFEGSKDGGSVQRTGASALDAFAARHFGKRANFTPNSDSKGTLRRMVEIYKHRIYDEHPSRLGPYFRLLYQTFTMIRHADIDTGDKIRYSKIARGQLSEGTTLLLALNALTTRGTKFVAAIEGFGLLEHMHPGYLDRYKPALSIAYREHAFQGSIWRTAHPLGNKPTESDHFFDPDYDVVTQGSETPLPDI